jgi:hypothetical protein
VVDPDTPPEVAETVVEPAATEVASPFEPAALLTVATPVDEELQVTDAVTSWVVLSEYVPVAMNCRLVPLTMPGLVGVMSRETRVAGVTVNVVDADSLPDAAVIVVEPAATEVASPFEPAALLMEATPVSEEPHTAELVRSWVDPSEYVPVTVNCRFVPLTILGLVGVRSRETRVAGVTVSVVDAETPPDVAVIVVEPAATEVASPREPAALLTVAIP